MKPKPGPATYLNTREVEEALPVVMRMYLEEACSQKKVAKRLGCHERTLYYWMRANDLRVKFFKAKVEYLARSVRGELGPAEREAIAEDALRA